MMIETTMEIKISIEAKNLYVVIKNKALT